MNVVVPGFDRKVRRILDDIDAEAAATQRLYDTEQALMDNRPSAEGQGVDISAVKALDPSFDDQRFLSVARESFYGIRKARVLDNPALADGEPSPQLMSALGNVVNGDVASHRHHLLPGLEVRTAVIQSVDVTGGKITIVVRFHLESEEVDRDTTGRVVAGGFSEHNWDEDWTFWRDPAIGPAPTDRERRQSGPSALVLPIVAPGQLGGSRPVKLIRSRLGATTTGEPR
jgi:predicted lipid-binding transport protein (Tim44 family)